MRRLLLILELVRTSTYAHTQEIIEFPWDGLWMCFEGSQQFRAHTQEIIEFPWDGLWMCFEGSQQFRGHDSTP